MAVAVGEWITRMDAEYLDGFIPGSGGAVKFVVGDADTVEELAAALRRAASARGLPLIAVDAADTKLHMIQDVFFAVARAMDWEGMAQGLVERLFGQHSYAWPRPGEATTLDEVAAANAVAPSLLRREFRQWITAAIWDDARMTQDFRNAMMQLCLLRLDPPGGGDEAAGIPVLQWLRGELKSIVTLRSAGIFSRIGRHNARAMLSSVCGWLMATGRPGLVVALDIRQLGRTAREVASGHRYTAAAVMDGFEVLRQLIDDIDRFAGLFLAVLADPALVDGVDSKRIFSAYTALDMRISNDVRARGADNPIAPLVTLGAG